MWQSVIGEQNREMAEFCPRFQQNGRTIINATSKRAQERKPDVVRDVHPLHVQDDIQEEWVRAQHRCEVDFVVVAKSEAHHVQRKFEASECGEA